MLDKSLAHYLPDAIDPDDSSVKERCATEDVELDHVLSPLVILLTNLCQKSVDCRRILRESILPMNLLAFFAHWSLLELTTDFSDRNSPLEGRADTLGRCIRLMACVSHQRLRETVGELLFVLCDSDGE